MEICKFCHKNIVVLEKLNSFLSTELSISFSINDFIFVSTKKFPPSKLIFLGFCVSGGKCEKNLQEFVKESSYRKKRNAKCVYNKWNSNWGSKTKRISNTGGFSSDKFLSYFDVVLWIKSRKWWRKFE